MRGLGFALGASLLALATQANAQATDARPRDGAAQTREAPPEPDAAPADIVVTAQKRSESLQRVPIAVSAFSGDTIQRKAIDDAVDLSFSVPNLTVTDVGNASLRGVGNLAISSTAEGGLAYHVNGAYLGNPGAETEYYDLERIEVLRGPQGTLYGRNSTAGVINIITAKPTAELGGYVTGSYGNYNNKKLQGAINLPITNGLGVRIAGLYLDRDGYSRNLYTGRAIDDRHIYGVRGTLRAQVADTTATLVVSYFNEDDSRANVMKGLCTKDRTFGCSALSAGFQTPDTRSTLFNTLGAITGTLTPGADYFATAVNPTDLRTVNQDIEPRYFVREWNASLELAHEFGKLTVTSLTGYQNIKRNILNDFDRFAPAAGVTLLRPVTFDALADGNRLTTTQITSARRDVSDAEQWFQEGRLQSHFAGPFNFLLGANYYHYETNVLVSITHPTLAAFAQLRGWPTLSEAYTVDTRPSTTESWGVFGEAYLNLAARTRLTLGVRYSHDSKSILTRQILLTGTIPPYTSGSNSWGVVTGRAVLDHRFSDRVLGYVSLSRGYKAGGLNPGGPADGLTFRPEYLNAAELGIKASTRDNSATLNLAAFYYDYSGLQIGQVGQTSAITVNADARIWGVEAEAVLRPTSRLRFDASFSYLDTRINRFQSGDQGDPSAIAPGAVIVRGANGAPLLASDGTIIKDLAGNQLPFSPTTKIAVGIEYQLPLGGGYTLTPRADHYQQGRFFGTAFNKPVEDFPGYSQTNLQLTFGVPGGRWQIKGYAKNLFDNADITRMTQDGPQVGRFRGVVLLEPRTYGAEATIRF
ncbi:MAG: TonB-dependent receptor [Sphingomonas sp.]|uniref:TonB-dependent receptor n=1 Tax=Sphingomonas sp. TaxID=28214 RepID=UPI0025DEFC83|nr:TonB-dependent receptor [Sphingomonas sp.]MBX9881487.1 TonB-dependent receptor [Sphingomonas sp.]